MFLRFLFCLLTYPHPYLAVSASFTTPWMMRALDADCTVKATSYQLKYCAFATTVTPKYRTNLFHDR